MVKGKSIGFVLVLVVLVFLLASTTSVWAEGSWSDEGCPPPANQAVGSSGMPAVAIAHVEQTPDAYLTNPGNSAAALQAASPGKP